MLNVNITGIPQEQSKLNQAVDTKEIEQALMRAGLQVERDAKLTCRDMDAIDTGRLIGSISTNWDNSGKAHGEVQAPAKTKDGVNKPVKKSGDVAVVRVGSNVKYAPYVHDGTKRMMARPFLEVALIKNEKAIAKEIENCFSKK